jgi:peptide/nickel transport system substrate-binding protein
MRRWLLGAGAMLWLLLCAPAARAAAALPTLRTTTDVGLAAPLNVNSLLPIFNNESVGDATINQRLFAHLLWIGNSITIRWHKSLARSITVADHDTRFLVRIRPWRWSDGRPVTAADVVYSFQLIRADGLRYLNFGMGGMPGIVARMTVLGPHRFVVVVRHRVNPLWFELNGLSQLKPLPRFAWKGYSAAYLTAHQIDPRLVRVVDGPYRLERFVMGREVVLVRNPRFSGPPAPLGRLIYKMYTSSEGAFWALRSGHLDVGNIPHALYRARRLLRRLRSCYTNGGFGINYIPFNFRNPRVAFLRNVRIRRALQYALNQRLIIDVAYNGFGVPGFNPVPGSPPTYLSPEMRHLERHPGLMYRPAHARALLRQAGWRRRPGEGWVRRNAEGQPLAFTLLFFSGSRTIEVAVDIMKEQWRAIGVNVHLRELPFNLVLAKLDDPHDPWQAAYIAWNYEPDYYPTGEGLFNTGGGENYGDYSNPRLDQLIHETNVKPGRRWLYAYERFAARHLPVLFTPFQGNIVKYSPRFTLAQAQSTLYDVACTPSRSGL